MRIYRNLFFTACLFFSLGTKGQPKLELVESGVEQWGEYEVSWERFEVDSSDRSLVYNVHGDVVAELRSSTWAEIRLSERPHGEIESRGGTFGVDLSLFGYCVGISNDQILQLKIHNEHTCCGYSIKSYDSTGQVVCDQFIGNGVDGYNDFLLTEDGIVYFLNGSNVVALNSNCDSLWVKDIGWAPRELKWTFRGDIIVTKDPSTGIGSLRRWAKGTPEYNPNQVYVLDPATGTTIDSTETEWKNPMAIKPQNSTVDFEHSSYGVAHHHTSDTAESIFNGRIFRSNYPNCRGLIQIEPNIYAVASNFKSLSVDNQIQEVQIEVSVINNSGIRLGSIPLIFRGQNGLTRIKLLGLVNLDKSRFRLLTTGGYVDFYLKNSTQE